MNGAIAVLDLATGQYHLAAAMVAVVALQSWLFARVDCLLAARVAKADAERRLAQAALAEFERQVAQGRVEFETAFTGVRH